MKKKKAKNEKVDGIKKVNGPTKSGKKGRGDLVMLGAVE